MIYITTLDKHFLPEISAAHAFGDSRDAAAPSPTQPTRRKRHSLSSNDAEMIRHAFLRDVALRNRL
ncbi:MAG: hypothetical protein ACK412_00740 [Chloroherpetonaceae bacterium]